MCKYKIIITVIAGQDVDGQLEKADMVRCGCGHGHFQNTPLDL